MNTRLSILLAVLMALVTPSLAQQTWTVKTTPIHSNFGYYAAAAYDSSHNQVVLFGGVDSTFFTNSDETWTWDGSNWTKQSPINRPTGRAGFGMAYDAARGQVLIFGGSSADQFLNDTWAWDGTNWTQKAAGPGPRLHVGMTYDGARQEILLFGGSDGSPTPFGDTWVFDGSVWTRKFPVHSPGLRSNYRLTYDEVNAQVVLFGGWNGSGETDETWVWNGTDWTQKFPPTSPPPRQDPVLAYDSIVQRVVLFGGITPNCNPVENSTWLWDGTNWTRQSSGNNPSGRGGASAAYDSARGEVVMFGGNDCSQIFTDTWVYGSTLAAQVQSPINADGSSVFNSKRGVVPVKFALTSSGSATCDLPSATLTLYRTSGGTPGIVNQSDYIMPADDGSSFRITGCQYLYNLGTGQLGVGAYQIKVIVSGSIIGTAVFGLN